MFSDVISKWTASQWDGGILMLQSTVERKWEEDYSSKVPLFKHKKPLKIKKHASYKDYQDSGELLSTRLVGILSKAATPGRFHSKSSLPKMKEHVLTSTGKKINLLLIPPAETQ